MKEQKILNPIQAGFLRDCLEWDKSRTTTDIKFKLRTVSFYLYVNNLTSLFF